MEPERSDGEPGSACDAADRRDPGIESCVHRERLERTVAERTAALQKANERLAGLVRDLQASEERARQSLAFVETLFSEAPVRIAFLDRGLRFIRVNEAMAGADGLSADAHPGRTFSEVAPDRAAPLEQHLEHVLETGRPIHDVAMQERDAEAPDGLRCWRVDFFPIRDPDGEVLGAGIIMGEVTEQKRAEQERTRLLQRAEEARAQAEEAERRAAFLSAASSLLASSIDLDTVLRSVAHLAIPYLADWCTVDLLEEDGRLRRPAVAHRDPSKEPALVEMGRRYAADREASHPVSRAIRTGEPLLLREATDEALRQAAPEPGHRELLEEVGVCSSIVVVLRAREHLVGVMVFTSVDPGHLYGSDDLALAEEIADRAALAIDNARLYRQAQEANAAKDQFLAVLSHELRNPLAPILAGADVLRRTVPRETRTERTLDIIERNVRLQARLVDDLLDLSRIARGKVQLRHDPIALDAVARSAIQTQQPAADDAGLALHVSLEQDLWVQGDFDRLQQVVMNLLGNAIKFTPAGGSVGVLCFAHNTQQARIVVEDTGIGIPKEQLASLFEMFRQGEVAGRRAAGLGIGLALVKSLVEMHGGRVWAESAGAGQGSRFIVELPLAEPPGRRQAVESAAETAETPLILLIEGNADTRTLLQESLELAGHSVHAEGSGEGALRWLADNHPAVILSDIALPGMDGCEFLKRARELPGLSDVPAFALTGYGQDEDARPPQEAGYTGHFVKPVDVTDLDRRVRETLGLLDEA